MELVNVQKEILCEWLGVGKALQNAVHEASITKILETTNASLRVLTHHFEKVHAHTFLLFLVYLSLVFGHLLEFIIIALLFVITFCLTSVYEGIWNTGLWILSDSYLVHESFLISNIYLIDCG